MEYESFACISFGQDREDTMKLSDYCSIGRNGTAWIDIDSGWKFHCTLYGIIPEYAQIFIRRLSKKRRLYDENELLDAEVMIPDMDTQKFIVNAIKTVEKLFIATEDVSSAYSEIQQMTCDSYYDTMRRYYSNLLGELNDHRFMLIDQLMRI